MLGFECKSQISTVMEFFEFVPRQARFIDMLWAVRWAAKILQWNRRTTFNVLMTSHLLYVTKGHYSLKTTRTNITWLLFFTEIFVWKTTAGHRVCQDYDISVNWFVCRKGELNYFWWNSTWTSCHWRPSQIISA